jgi:hypothetical protein
MRLKNNILERRYQVNYIGADNHIGTLDFKVVNEAGKLIKAEKVATGASNFLEFVRSVPKPRMVIDEDGTFCRLSPRDLHPIRRKTGDK